MKSIEKLEIILNCVESVKCFVVKIFVLFLEFWGCFFLVRVEVGRVEGGLKGGRMEVCFGGRIM